MADMISRAAAIEAILDSFNAIKAIEGLTAVDAVPVVHGRWVERMYKTGDITTISYFCSKCDGEHYFGRANYCQNCGAKMDGERRGEDETSGD